jgi:hypothetical protein
MGEVVVREYLASAQAMQLGYYVPLGKKTYTIVYLHRRTQDFVYVSKPGSGREFALIHHEFQLHQPKGRRFVPPYKGYQRP